MRDVRLNCFYFQSNLIQFKEKLMNPNQNNPMPKDTQKNPAKPQQQSPAKKI